MTYQDKNDASDEEDVYLSDEEGTTVDGIYIPPPTKPTLSFDPTGPRLIITKIVNYFFKSYANEITLGPFHKCFNAILGPNGSGKSNVIDSMLFVFGYRATKIRSKKLSVLLHNSDQYRNVNSCTVSVHFALIVDREGDKYDVQPNSEFVVSRTASKDNTSFYELNGRRVQFKEVGMLLKKHGIDLDHNRFLILQGEVEQIAMMKCRGENDNETGMLEYLEDIIGTSRYKKPIAQLEERVENLSEQRNEKLNRVKIVEKELDTLKEPMEEAVQFLKTENTVVRSKNFLYQKNIFDLQKTVREVDEQSKEIKEIQQGFVEKLAALASERGEIEKVYNKELAVCDKLRKRKDGLKEAFDNANKRDIQLQEDMTSKNKARKKTKDLINLEKQKIEKLEKVPEQSKEGIEECETKIEEMSAKKEKLDVQKKELLSKIQVETEGLQQQKAEMQKDLAVLKEAVDKTKSVFDIAETELKMYVSGEESERLKYDNLKNLVQSNEATIKERTRQVATLKNQIPANEDKLKRANEELCKIKIEETRLTADVRSKRSSLEEGRSSLQASNSRNKVLDALMRAKREGKCPGLFGRLGDLGAIDQKYDVAISTCCGALDNIVVDTVDCAQWCIEFLKKYDVGRATFIALEKQEHLRGRAERGIQTPENAPRLYDLVRTPDDRVRPAFYYALSDTLVANDLDQASRIAYGAQRYRVVTLKGDLIETTGTMSGGGRSVMKGRMSSKAVACSVDPREIERLESEVRGVEEKIRELRQRQVALENEINSLTADLRPMKIDLEKYGKELQSLTQQLPRLKKQMHEQEIAWKSKRADPKQVKILTDVVESKGVEYDRATETANALQVEVDKLTKQIKDRSTGRISVVDKEIREANKIMEKCKSEITRLRVAVKTAERNYKAAKENLSTMEQDVTNMENSLREMKEERTQIEEDAAKLLRCIEEVTGQLDERDEKLKEMGVKTGDIGKKEKELKSEKIDIDVRVKAFDKKINDINGTIHGWNTKIKSLSLQEIPEEPGEELKKYTDEEIQSEDEKKYQRELEAAESHLKAAKPNLYAIQEYKKTRAIFLERFKELEVISNKRDEMRKLFDNLRSQRKEEFITGYNIIRLKLKEMYQMITLGGDADFEMVDTYDPFTEGIQFNVRPPKKSWKKICNLSGGEKTLSSLALVFALHYYKPSPLYFMDEIDAALDFKNVSIVGHYIKERTKNAQFIIISLRLDMFELADNMIGIYKNNNCTKTITINPKAYADEEEVGRVENLAESVRNVTSTESVGRKSLAGGESTQIEPDGQALDETEIRASQENDEVLLASQNESQQMEVAES